MPLFYAAEKKLFAKYGIEGTVVLSGWAGDQAVQLATGKVEMGVIPYTNAIAAYTRSPSFSVVSGSGIQGLIMASLEDFGRAPLWSVRWAPPCSHTISGRAC